jgi:hypothetical protein
MSATPDSTLADPRQIIADLRRGLPDAREGLAERTADSDEAHAREVHIPSASLARSRWI